MMIDQLSLFHKENKKTENLEDVGLLPILVANLMCKKYSKPGQR